MPRLCRSATVYRDCDGPGRAPHPAGRPTAGSRTGCPTLYWLALAALAGCGRLALAALVSEGLGTVCW